VTSRPGTGARNHRFARWTGLALAACVVVALVTGPSGCGGSDEPSAAQSKLTPSSDQSQQPEKIVVSATNGRFSPEAIYRTAAPGVVTVISLFRGGGLSLLGNQGAAGQGSGFVVNTDGEIVTNAHVVTNGEGNSVQPAKRVYVEFADRNRVQATIEGYDPQGDVALLKVDPDGLHLAPLQLSDGKGIAVGQPVAAIGSPFGEVQSLSVGVISATDRAIDSLTGFQIDNAIQTDTSINPGNSGGPLLDAKGRVIGITQQIETRSGSNSGVGFAVPIDVVRRSVDQLRANGHVDYAYLGVSSQALYPQLAEHLGIDSQTGALLAEVVPGGPAEKAGLRGGDKTIRFQESRIKTGGDVIVAVNGHKLVGENDLAEQISQYHPGDKVTLQIIRDGATKDVDVELGKRPNSAPK
jgi:S1-C subfamily serine protease